MDHEMIERVSKAILETPNASDYATLVAINAIKAMRQPTADMIKNNSNWEYYKFSRMIADIVGGE